MAAPSNEPRAGRLSFGFLVRELQHYLHLEKGLPHTFVDLVIRPGRLLRGYFDGRYRHEYTNPVVYSLMATAASLLAFGTYRDAFSNWMRARVATLPTAAAPDSFLQAYLGNLFVASQRAALSSFLLAIPMALPVWLLFRSPRLNLAEAFAFALYAIGTYLFAHALAVSPIVYATHHWIFAQYAGLALQVAIPLWLGLRLFGGTGIGTLKLLVAIVTGTLAGYVLFALTVATYTAATLH